MHLFIDECLSPKIAHALNEAGECVALHPRNNGGCGDPDHVVLARAIDYDAVIVTQNAVDFRKLVGREEIHPGLIVLPAVGRDASAMLLEQAIRFLRDRGDPMDLMINHVLEVAENGEIIRYELPKPA